MAVVSYPGVYVEEVASGIRPISAASTSTPAFVGIAQSGPTHEARRVTNWTEFERLYGTFLTTGYLAQSVFQFFNNGGQQCYVVRVAPRNASLASLTTQDSAEPPTPGLQLSAKHVGAWANSLTVTIEHVGEERFRLTIERMPLPDAVEPAPPLEVHDQLSMVPGAANYAVDVLRERSSLLNARDLHGDASLTAGQRRPAQVRRAQLGASTLQPPLLEAQPGADGEIAGVNEQLYADAFALLDAKTDFSLLAVPGVATSAMANAGMAYCRRRPLQDVFYLGDMPRDTSPDDAAAFRRELNPTSFGAVYYPWVKALDPAGQAPGPILLPPSGFVAGLYARIDARRGVWKAPAGTEAGLAGALGLATELTDVQQGVLNPLQVNCLRRFPAAGIVAWGARTVNSDPEYGYVPVRRMAILLRVSIYNGIQWAVFEPNDEELWSQIRLNIRSFMTTLFRQGAFQGATPGEAFFVKCDAETTTQDDINLGIVNVLVGFAPLKPAEFVVVKISQKVGPTA